MPTLDWIGKAAVVNHHRKVMDEIFGRKKFVATVVWGNFYGRSNAACISPSHNYVVVYSPLGVDWKNVRNLQPRDEKSANTRTLTTIREASPRIRPRAQHRRGVRAWSMAKPAG